jgi:hypothetical protein
MTLTKPKHEKWWGLWEYLGIQHIPINVKKCKEVNLKHTLLSNILGVVVLSEF